MRTTGYPTLNENGEMIGLKGIFQDITNIYQMQVAIEEQQEAYDLLANNIIDIMCIFELDGLFRYVTPSVKKILGYDQSEIMQRKF